jgi:hypothetical protein
LFFPDREEGAMTPRKKTFLLFRAPVIFLTAIMGMLLLYLAESAAQSGENLNTPAQKYPPEEYRRYVNADAFRRRYTEKTVHLLLEGQHYGSEYYMPGDRSLWVGEDGPCRPGYWIYQEPQFCFQYEDDGPYCWKVFDYNTVTYAESADGLVLEIYAIDEEPLTCDPALLS